MRRIKCRKCSIPYDEDTIDRHVCGLALRLYRGQFSREFTVRFRLKPEQKEVNGWDSSVSPMTPILYVPGLSLSENFMRAHYLAHGWLEEHHTIQGVVQSLSVTLEETYL